MFAVFFISLILVIDESVRVRMSQAIVIMISTLLENSSDCLDAVLIGE